MILHFLKNDYKYNEEIDKIISGIKDENLINSILKYNATFTHINTNNSNRISENPLNALRKFENYDAIFIDDDANWYTLINE